MLDSGHKFRSIELESAAKVLACGTTVTGAKHYGCSDPSCTHTKVIALSCKSRLCNSCGQKATEQWMCVQKEILPDCSWRHLTFTMPSVLWKIFQLNRHLLGDLFRISSQILLQTAKKKKLIIGMFSALHTYGRQLNFNCHIHLSLAEFGLNQYGDLVPFTFPFKDLMSQWRYLVITLLRQQPLSQLILPETIVDEPAWKKVLNDCYNQYWQVKIAKKTSHKSHTAKYLGSYLKKPPIAGSRLRHYVDENVHIDYLDHRSKTNKTMALSHEELILRVLTHVPEKHFKMLRYYGFMSNRLRGKLLDIIYDKLDQKVGSVIRLTYAAMMKSFTNQEPYVCILCGSAMRFLGFERGASLSRLMFHLRKLAKLRPI